MKPLVAAMVKQREMGACCAQLFLHSLTAQEKSLVGTQYQGDVSAVSCGNMICDMVQSGEGFSKLLLSKQNKTKVKS